MNKIFYLILLVYTPSLICTESSDLKLLTVAVKSLMVNTPTYRLENDTDFIQLRNVQEGDTIRTLTKEYAQAQILQNPRLNIDMFYHFSTGNFVSTPLSNGTHIMHIMQPGPVTIKKIFQSYHPEMSPEHPWIEYDESFSFDVSSCKPLGDSGH